MSERVKALGLALMNSPEWGGKPPMATCTVCGEPLIATMRWPGYEFYCVCCERHLGFVEPVPMLSTPEVEARQRELQDRFDGKWPLNGEDE